MQRRRHFPVSVGRIPTLPPAWRPQPRGAARRCTCPGCRQETQLQLWRSLASVHSPSKAQTRMSCSPGKFGMCPTVRQRISRVCLLSMIRNQGFIESRNMYTRKTFAGGASLMKHRLCPRLPRSGIRGGIGSCRCSISCSRPRWLGCELLQVQSPASSAAWLLQRSLGFGSTGCPGEPSCQAQPCSSPLLQPSGC